MTSDATTTASAGLPPGPTITTASVGWGPTSTLGVALTIAGAVGSIIAAVKANDTATVTAGIATVLAAVSTLGGRYAQAVAAARGVAQGAQPWAEAIGKAPDAPSPTQARALTAMVQSATLRTSPDPPQRADELSVPADLDDSVHERTEGDPRELVDDDPEVAQA